MLLAVFGVLFAALFLINNLVKTLLKRERISFLDLLLAFLAALLPGLGLLFEALNGSRTPLLTNLLLVLGGVVAVFSVLLILAELRRPQRLRQSRGILGLGIGSLLALASISIPNTAVTFAIPTPTPIQVAAQGSNSRPTETVLPSPTPTSTATLTATVTYTPTARATSTATATRWAYQSPTPLPTLTLSAPCIALVDFNLRLRALPDRDSETLLVIPFSTTITLYARSQDSSWWFAKYEDQTGWVDGEFITRSASCDELSVQTP
ncbi:MAG: hypothetical protein KC519_11165 [Anaerolineae bacterium]|nr:hypothetical protein [Anaerolineae bacterium]